MPFRTATHTIAVWLSTFRVIRFSRCQRSLAHVRFTRYRSASWPWTVSSRYRIALSRADRPFAVIVFASTGTRTYTDQAADLQEADAEYLENVRRVYLEVAGRGGPWRVVNVEQQGMLRTIDDIARELVALTQDAARMQ